MGEYSFHRLRAVPLPRGGRSGGEKIGSWWNVGGRAMRAPTLSTACVYSFHRLRAVPLPRRGRSLGRGIGSWWNVGGRAMRELLPPPAGGPPPSKREVFGEGNRELAECRRVRDARTPSTACGRSPSLEEGGLWGGESGVCRMSAGNCNCEMRLQRWVASLQRLDAFATVGCTAVHRRGAHRAPVYLRCYNNLSSGRAKGHRGDRKAPICNRRQGRRP